MAALFQINAVQLGVTTHNSKCERDLDSVPQLRYGAQLNTSRQARAACGVVGTRIASTLVKSQCGDFHTLVEPCSHRTSLRRAAGEGMAPGESELHRPGLIGRASSFYCESAGCNRSLREQASLGSGNHRTRRFQMRSDQPTAMYAKQTTAQTMLWGWFVLAPSLRLCPSIRRNTQ